MKQYGYEHEPTIQFTQFLSVRMEFGVRIVGEKSRTKESLSGSLKILIQL